MADKPVHIRDLFKTGKLVSIQAIGEDDELLNFEIWMRKPTVSDQQEASDKANARAALIRNRYREKDGDAYVSLVEGFQDFEAKDCIDMLVEFRRPTLEKQAHNSVMYDESVGSDWSPDGGDYLNIVMAAANRLIEIEKHNAELSVEDRHLMIRPEDDETYKQLNDTDKIFKAELDVELNRLLEMERRKYAGQPLAKLKEELAKKMMDLEAGLARGQVYKMELLHRACRYPENKKRYYFESSDEIEALPQSIRSQLIEEFDTLEYQADDIKNLLSLLPS